MCPVDAGSIKRVFSPKKIETAAHRSPSKKFSSQNDGPPSGDFVRHEWVFRYRGIHSIGRARLLAGRMIRRVTYFIKRAVSYGPPGVGPYRVVANDT
jgi:hypothetical protein